MAKDGPPHSTAPLGAKNLWNTPGLELPGEVRQMARAIAESSGKTISQALRISWGVLRNWASGRGNVTPKTRAKAVRLLAELDAARAKAKATPNKRDRVAASHELALAQGPACKCGGPHDLVWFSNRSTPRVVHPGDDPKSTDATGNVTNRRRANAREEKQIASGQWVRVDAHGRKPGDDGYTKSKLRPQLASAQRPLSGLALAGRHHAGPQRYKHGWIPVDGGGSPKHGKPEKFAEGAADSKRPPLDPQHVSDVKDRLDELAKHAPEIARRQRALLNDLHKQGKLTSERLRSAKSGIDRLITNHRKNKPSTDPGLVAISHARGPDALALAAGNDTPAVNNPIANRRSSRMATTPMTDSGSGPAVTKNSSSKKPSDAKAAVKAAGNSADEDKVKAAAKALMARGWPLPKAMKAAKELVAKQKSSATQDAKAS